MQGKKPTWIWYNNDFDFLLYNKLMQRRFQRENYISSMWKVDSVYNAVSFLKIGNLSAPTTLRISCSGLMAVCVDSNPNFSVVNDGKLYLESGEHNLRIDVFNDKGLPCLFIDGGEFSTDTSWLTSCRTPYWDKVGSGEFNSAQENPNDYSLPTREINGVELPKVLLGHGLKGRLFDFDRETFGYPVITNIKKSGGVTICYGESLEEALDIENCEVLERANLVNSKFVGNYTRAFRYVYVIGDAEYETFSALEEYYDKTNRGAFVSNNALLNKIYDTSLYTLELTSREMYIDGIKRDRWVWSGDAIQSELMNYYTFFDKEITKRTCIALCGKEKIGYHINFIMDYSFYLIMSVLNYYTYSADIEFVKSIYERLNEIIDYCISRLNENGFMQAKDGDWVFVDWADINNCGEVCLEQILLLKSLESLREMSVLVGKEFDSVKNEIIARLPSQIEKAFWVDGEGFKHDSQKLKTTKYGNIFAILYNLVDSNKRETIAKKVLLNPDVQEIVTPYMKFYELSALAEIGKKDKMLDFILSYWGEMINVGATSFWEEFNPNVLGVEKYAMYGRKYGKSLCHSWGASPLYLIGRYLVGLVPTAAGYESFELNPYLSELTYSAKLPTCEGEITVEYDVSTLKVFSSTHSGTLILDKIVKDIKYEHYFKDEKTYISIKPCKNYEIRL